MARSPRLLANENIPRPAILHLRRAGLDVLSIAETLPAGSDQVVLALARAQGRWLLTYDRDYGELVFRRGLPAPPAILYFRQEPFPATRVADLVLPLLELGAEIEGYFVVVGEHNLRRNRLPKSGGG